MSADIPRRLPDDRRAEVERALLARLAGRSQRSIPRYDRASAPPLSFAQERMWVFSCLHPGNTAGNFTFRYALDGKLDKTALRRALETIQERHEVLRTVIRQRRQVILDPFPVELPGRDLRLDPGRADELARELAAVPFPLDKVPPVRWHLLRLADDRHELVACIHHIAADGWSEAVLDRELAALYRAYHRDEPDPLPPLPVQYADYAAWQRELYRDDSGPSLDWWQRELAGAPSALALPSDRAASSDSPFEAAWFTRRLPQPLAGRLAALCAKEKATLFMGLLAGFAATLSRLSGQDDLIIGAPVTGRQLPELETLIGFFINTIAIRIDTSGGPGLRTLLRRVRETALRAFDHQDVPLERVVERLAPTAEPGRAPLVQVMFQVYNVPQYRLVLPGLEVRRTQVLAAGGSALDLTLSVAAEADETGLDMLWEYRAALFNAATVACLHDCMVGLLTLAVADPEAPLAWMALTGCQDAGGRVRPGRSRAHPAPGNHAEERGDRRPAASRS